MKTLKYYIVPIMFFFIGCSTWQPTNFSSKQEYVSHINETIGNRKIEINLKNDSSFISENGGVINNDTLYLNGKNISLDNVNEISYKSHFLTTIFGGVSGFFLGALIGAGIGSLPGNFRNAGNTYVVSSIVGTLVGTVTWGIIGWKTIYKFDQ